MLWETKQREGEIKHSRVSDLPPLNTSTPGWNGWCAQGALQPCTFRCISGFPLLRKRHTLILINIYLII